MESSHPVLPPSLLQELDPNSWHNKTNTSIQKQRLQAHIRDFTEGPREEWVSSPRNKGKDRPTRKTDRGSGKKKASVVRSHHSPQKPGQNGAARNTRGRQKSRATGEVLGRQLERVDQNGQPNPDKMGRGQTCLAFAATRCVHHISPMTT